MQHEATITRDRGQYNLSDLNNATGKSAAPDSAASIEKRSFIQPQIRSGLATYGDGNVCVDMEEQLSVRKKNSEKYENHSNGQIETTV